MLDRTFCRRLIRHLDEAIGCYQRRLLSFNEDNLSKDNELYIETLVSIDDATAIVLRLKKEIGDKA